MRSRLCVYPMFTIITKAAAMRLMQKLMMDGYQCHDDVTRSIRVCTTQEPSSGYATLQNSFFSFQARTFIFIITTIPFLLLPDTPLTNSLSYFYLTILLCCCCRCFSWAYTLVPSPPPPASHLHSAGNCVYFYLLLQERTTRVDVGLLVFHKGQGW